MRLAYLYNEILPTRKAHDAYVWRNCVSLAEAGEEVVLACGSGSACPAELAVHYLTPLPKRFQVRPLAIVRRNLGLPITLNAVFNAVAQRLLERERPDATLLSVRKPGAYHLSRRVPGTRYVYEVHELEWYPTSGEAARSRPEVEREREMLASADLVTVTTDALRRILLEPPYSLDNTVAVVPLAIAAPPKPPAVAHAVPLHVMYIGQLYAGQGVENLVAAAACVPEVVVTIVGGSVEDVQRISALVPSADASRIRLAGFMNPADIPALAASAHVLVAPFMAQRRMPFVAHTKLVEYVALRRPVVAPDLPIVHEHFPDGAGLCTYAADDVEALAVALRGLADRGRWERLAQEIATVPFTTWDARAAAYSRLLRAL